MIKKFIPVALLAISTLTSNLAMANWHNIPKVQYLMQNLDDRDSIVTGYANDALLESINDSLQYSEGGVCSPWDMLGGTDFDADAVSSSVEFSITDEGWVRADYQAFYDSDYSTSYFAFDDDGLINDIYDADGYSFRASTHECLENL